MIFRNHNNTLICCLVIVGVQLLIIVLIIINIENSCAASYFCENCDTFNFSGFFVQKEQHLFEMEIFCDIKCLYRHF